MTPRSWTIQALRLAALSLALGGCAEGCGGGGDDTYAVDSGVPLDGACLEASERVGALACVHAVPNRATFEAISAPAMAADQLAATKFLLPAPETADPLPRLFLNVNQYALHYDLMVEAFPERFPGFTRVDYVRLLAYDKQYFAGNIAEYFDPRGEGTFFGFTVWDDPADDSTTVTMAQVEHVWRQLSEVFALGELVFVPSSSNQSAAVEGWDAPFPIRGVESSLDYEVYTQAEGYGQLTLMTLEELAQATEDGALSTEQILILDEAPFDVERVISGAVTGTRQGQLSHLNVRSAARGTPNCYVADPFEVLAQWDGQLVRLECGAEALSVRAATREEAEAWWASIRPEPVAVPALDLNTRALPGLLELPTDSAAERAAAVSAYGSKGANLSSLYQRIPAELQLEGFLVPFVYYVEFMEGGAWVVDLGEGEGEHSFAETLAAWSQDEAFLSDAALRRERLEALREAMLLAPVDPTLLAALEARVVEVFGSPDVMVRLRSSSNAEDALGFSGAGLYDSESACVADSQDGDADGPSLCDPDKASERTIEDALRAVWASTWKMQAYEERDWYGIAHDDVAMGVLVNTRSKDEIANIVAFTGNPGAEDDRYVINAQIGDLDVVSAEPGVYPERNLIVLNEAGAVVEILRVAGSSELSEGFVVLSDARVIALAESLWQIEQVWPVDEPAPEGATILLDTEWKVLEDGRLIIKQVRPFLRDMN